jgi:hypothetical protein
LRKTAVSIMVLLVLTLSQSALSGSEPERSIGLSLSAGSIHSVNGTLKENSETRDITSTGLGFGISLEKWISKYFKTGITAYLSWVDIDSSVYPGEKGTPAFSLKALIFKNTYHISDRTLRPFISAGAGLYQWTVCQDGPLGDPITFEGEDMQKTSIGLNGGGGLEYLIDRRFSLSLEANYSYILSRDSFHFGKHFSAQGMVGLQLGISYNILSK